MESDPAFNNVLGDSYAHQSSEQHQPKGQRMTVLCMDRTSESVVGNNAPKQLRQQMWIMDLHDAVGPAWKSRPSQKEAVKGRKR